MVMGHGSGTKVPLLSRDLTFSQLGTPTDWIIPTIFSRVLFLILSKKITAILTPVFPLSILFSWSSQIDT